jgi:hypothetical protein
MASFLPCPVFIGTTPDIAPHFLCRYPIEGFDASCLGNTAYPKIGIDISSLDVEPIATRFSPGGDFHINSLSVYVINRIGDSRIWDTDAGKQLFFYGRGFLS